VANLIDIREDDAYPNNPTQGSKIAFLREQLSSITNDKKEQLANEMGIGADEDFPNA
jgi:hypothetical protein